MKTEDRDNFAQMMIALGEYYGRDISDGLMEMYWNGLAHFELPVVREALNRHMQNPDSGQFMPKVSDVVKMTTGSTQDSALLAWSKVDKAMRQVGCYESIVFDDPIIHRVIADMGGWIGLSNKTENEWVFVGKEFETRYKGYAARGERPEYPSVLLGIAQAQNYQLGYTPAPPRLIGDPERAKNVFENGSQEKLQITRLGELQASQKLLSMKDDDFSF